MAVGSSRARSHHLTLSPTEKSPRTEEPADFQLGFFSIFLQLVSPADFPVATSTNPIPSRKSLPVFAPYLQEDGTPWSWGCPASGFCPQVGALWSGRASSSASGSCFVSVSVSSALHGKNRFLLPFSRPHPEPFSSKVDFLVVIRDGLHPLPKVVFLLFLSFKQNSGDRCFARTSALPTLGCWNPAHPGGFARAEAPTWTCLCEIPTPSVIPPLPSGAGRGSAGIRALRGKCDAKSLRAKATGMSNNEVSD